MTYVILGKEVKLTFLHDLCGFWTSYASIEIGSERFSAASKKFLCDQEASIQDALVKLEDNIRKYADGVWVRCYEELLVVQRQRQALAKELISYVVPGSP